MRALVALSVSCLVGLTGCLRLAEPKIDYAGTDSHALIQVGDPQVFGRESLINDRREEMAFVRSRLDASVAPGFDMGTDLQRQVETIAAFSASLGLSFDSGVARQNRDAAEVAERQHEVDLLQLDLQLAQLQQQLARVRAGEEAGDAVADPAVAAAAPAPAPASTVAVATQLGEMLEKLRSRLTAGGIDRSTLKSNPRDQFRDLRAYRDELRAAYNEAQLDDVHDTEGRALYKLRMPINVLPGTETDRYAVTDFRLIAPPLGSKDYASLYYRWLGHLTMRLNAIGQDDRNDQLPDRQLQFFGTASKLFMPVTFYVSGRDAAGGPPAAGVEKESWSSAYDPCLAVQTAVLAEALGCSPLITAVPYRVGRRLTSVFPDLDDVRMAIVSHDLIDGARGLDQLAVTNSKGQVDSTDFMSLAINRITTSECRGDRYLPLHILAAFLDEAEKCDAHGNPRCEVSQIANVAARRLDANQCSFDVPKEPRNAEASRQKSTEAAGQAVPLPKQEPDYLSGVINVASNRSGRGKSSRAAREIPVWMLRRLDISSTTSEPEATRRILTYAIGEILRRASRLPWEKRRWFMPRDRLIEVLYQLGEMEKSLVAVSKGLAARDGLAIATRARAEHLTQSLVDAQRLRAALCLQGAVLTSRRVEDMCASRTDQCAGLDVCEFEKQLKDAGDAEIRVYAVSPRQLDQRVSMISDAAQALQLAVAVQANDPAGGRSAAAATGLSQQATSRAGAIERNPLVVGYARNSDKDGTEGEEQPAKEAAGFGWVLGPRARVHAGWLRDQVKFDFVPTTFDVSVDIAVPAWFPYVQLEQRGDWASDWSRAGTLFSGSPAVRTVRVDLPISRSDLDALTRQLAKPFGAAVPTARITRVEPDELNLCGEQLKLAVRGVDLWRGASLSINGVEPKGLVEVQPDMEGISASFDVAKLIAAIPAGASADLAVATQSGFDRYSVPVAARAGSDKTCMRPAGDPALVVVPSETHRCTSAIDLRLSLREKVSAAAIEVIVDAKSFKASCAQTPKAGDPAPCDLWKAHVVVDPKARAGRDSLPVVALLPSGPREVAIKLVGDGKSCQAKAAEAPSAKPVISSVLTPAGGELFACRAHETVTLQGSKLGSVDAAKLNGVSAATVKASAGGDVLTLEFVGLPTYPLKQPPGAKETALTLLTAGTVVASQNLAWSACTDG